LGQQWQTTHSKFANDRETPLGGLPSQMILPWPRPSLPETMRLRAAEEGIPVRLALDLPAGEVTLRIVTYAPGAATTGSLEIPVQTTGP